MRHVALMTGLKHYLGPFEAYAVGEMADTPFHEEEPRLYSPNFYYAQEDELFAAAERGGFTWSVHRSHTVFGFATGNAMNMVLTICAYATHLPGAGPAVRLPRFGDAVERRHRRDRCRAARRADHVGGDRPARPERGVQHANGDVFRWRWLWPQIAAYFGLEWEGYAGAAAHPRGRHGRHGGLWREIAGEHGLVEPDLAGWRPGGTPTATSAARSRCSPT